MPDLATTQLSAVTTVATTDILYLVKDLGGGAFGSRKVTADDLNKSFNHSSLANLSADDHTQYLRLAGRSSSQTVYGGTTAGGSLNLNSTIHATKGTIWFETFIKADMVNKVLSVRDNGNTYDAVKLTRDGTGGIITVNNSSATAVITLQQTTSLLACDKVDIGVASGSYSTSLSFKNGINATFSSSTDAVNLFVKDYAAGDARFYIQSEVATESPIIIGNGIVTAKSVDLSPHGNITVRGSTLLRGFINGLTLSNNATDAANDIDISAGIAMSETDGQLMELPSGITKRLDAAWAAGSGNGGLISGTKTNNTGYFVSLIAKSSTAASGGNCDVIFHYQPNFALETLPTGYDRWRRIGWIYVDNSGSIRSFRQHGDNFYWFDPTIDVNTTLTLSSSTYQVTLLVPPLGGGVNEAVFSVNFNISVLNASTANVLLYMNSDSRTVLPNIPTPSTTAAPLAHLVTGAANTYHVANITTILTGNGALNLKASANNTVVRISTLSWCDFRGRYDYSFI